LAAATGKVSHQTLFLCERGRQPLPARIVPRLARVLGCRVEELQHLLDETDDE
jgi:hypothetical protein